MEPWEYKTFSVTKRLKKKMARGQYDLDGKLNELGSVGWEFVALDPTANIATYLFKRPWYDEDEAEDEAEEEDEAEDYDEDGTIRI